VNIYCVIPYNIIDRIREKNPPTLWHVCIKFILWLFPSQDFTICHFIAIKSYRYHIQKLYIRFNCYLYYVDTENYLYRNILFDLRIIIINS